MKNIYNMHRDRSTGKCADAFITATWTSLTQHTGKWTHDLLLGLLLLPFLSLLGCDSRIRPDTPEGVALYSRSSPVIPVDQVGEFEWIYSHDVENAEDFVGKLLLNYDSSPELDGTKVIFGKFDLRLEVEAYALTHGAPPRPLLEGQPIRVLDKPGENESRGNNLTLTSFPVSKDRIRVVVRVTTPDAQWATANPRLTLGPIHYK